MGDSDLIASTISPALGAEKSYYCGFGLNGISSNMLDSKAGGFGSSDFCDTGSDTGNSSKLSDNSGGVGS